MIHAATAPTISAPFGLVVRLVVPARNEDAFDSGHLRQRLARCGRDDGVRVAVEDERRDIETTESIPDPALLPEPVPREPKRAPMQAQRVRHVGPVSYTHLTLPTTERV